MKNKKPTITYIKAGEEKTVELNLLNSSKIKKEIFNPNNWGRITLKKDIEYIHFQNIDFPLFINNEDRFCGIKNNYNTICVLENCDLKNKLNNEVSRIELTGGVFQLINIDANKFKTEIAINSHKEVLIDNTNLINSGHNLHFDSFHTFQKIEVKDNNSIDKMYLSTEEISLSGNFLLNDLLLSSDGIVKLGTNKNNTIINIIASGIRNIVIESNQLELNNCNIINDNPSLNVYINYKKIISNNFVIKSKGSIIINNKVILKEKNDEGYVVVTIKDLLRLKLNNVLATKLNQIERQIKLNTEHELTENSNQKLEANIKYQEELIEYNIKILKELKEELVNWNNTKRNNLIKSLKNKSVKYYN